MRQRTHDCGGKVRFEQLLGRHVDVDLHVLGPFRRRFPARLLQDPRTDRHDQARVFGERDEFYRADKAVLCAVPADQGLEADYRFRIGIDHGLVMQLHLVAFQRVAQRMFQLPLLLRIRMQRRFVLAVDPATFILGTV